MKTVILLGFPLFTVLEQLACPSTNAFLYLNLIVSFQLPGRTHAVLQGEEAWKQCLLHPKGQAEMSFSALLLLTLQC